MEYLFSFLPLVIETESLWDKLMTAGDTVINENLSAFNSIAVILAAVLAGIHLMRFASSYVNDGGHQFGWEFARPIVILICVIEFPMVCDTFSNVVNSFTIQIAKAADFDFTAYSKDFYKLVESAEGEIDKAFGSDDDVAASGSSSNDGYGLLGTAAPEQKSELTLWQKFKKMIKMGKILKNAGAIYTINTICMTLCQLSFIFFQILCALYLILLRLLGPFVFALSIGGWWKNGISGWVSRYIQITLWMPICYLVLFIMKKLNLASVDILITSIAEGGIGSGVGAYAMCIVLALATLSAIFAVPKIAAWVVESAGSGNAQSVAERGSSSMMRKMITKR